MKLKFSVNKKIKNSRKEEKVLERLGQSDFENTKRILLLLRSRLEFRSRSSLSIDEELDWIFYNESRTGAGAGNGTNTGNGIGTGTGGAMDAIGTSDLEMINNLDQNESRTGIGAGAGNGADTGTGNGIGTGGAMDAIGTSDLEMIDNLNQSILDLSMVENGQMENVKDQSGASTSGFWILDETVTPQLPHIYPALPSLDDLKAICEFCCPGKAPAVSTMPTAPTSPLPPQPQLVENGQMETSIGQSGTSTSGFQEIVTPSLRLKDIIEAAKRFEAASSTPTGPTAPQPPQPHHFCAPVTPLPSLYSISKTTREKLLKFEAEFYCA